MAPTLTKLGEHDVFAWQVGSDGTYVFTSSTPAATTGLYRYNIADISNTEGTGVWKANTVGRVDSGHAVTASDVWRKEYRAFNTFLYLDLVDPDTGGVVNQGDFDVVGTSHMGGRVGWNPSTGTVWEMHRGTEVREWVAGVSTLRETLPGTDGALSVPHADSSGAVWFTRSGSGSNSFTVWRHVAGTSTQLLSDPMSLARYAHTNNTGFIWQDQFVFNDDGTWKQIDSSGTVTTASFMAGAPTYTDSYTAAPIFGQNAVVIAFEGITTTVREIWLLAEPAGGWTVGRVAWGSRGAWH